MPVKVISINANSLVHANRRRLFLDFVSVTDGDIYCVQETCLDTNIRLHVDGFNLFRCDVRRGWGGVSLLVRSNIPVRGVTCSRAPIHFVSVECFVGGAWVRFASCYVPHRIVDIGDAFRSFLRVHCGSVIGGDFNSRHPDYGDSQSNVYGEALRVVTPLYHVRLLSPNLPSCFHARDGSFIDKFCVPTSLTTTDAVILPALSFSDHEAVSISIPVSLPSASSLPTPHRMFGLVNQGKIDRILHSFASTAELPSFSNLDVAECERMACAIDATLSDVVTRAVPARRAVPHRVILSATTRALQRRAKRIRRDYYSMRGLSPMGDILAARLGLLKGMIISNVRAETARFFTRKFDSVTDHRDAYRTIRRWTGHKSRPPFSGSVFVDPDKTSYVAGADAVANALAEQFDANHRLTFERPSPLDNIASQHAEMIRDLDLRIHFNNSIPASIENGNELDRVNGLLPYGQRDLLTCTTEVSEVLASRPNKPSPLRRS